MQDDATTKPAMTIVAGTILDSFAGSLGVTEDRAEELGTNMQDVLESGKRTNSSPADIIKVMSDLCETPGELAFISFLIGTYSEDVTDK